MNLPEVNPGELIGQYIGRLISEKIITTGQIPLAITKFNSK